MTPRSAIAYVILLAAALLCTRLLAARRRRRRQARARHERIDLFADSPDAG